MLEDEAEVIDGISTGDRHLTLMRERIVRAIAIIDVGFKLALSVVAIKSSGSKSNHDGRSFLCCSREETQEPG